MKKFTEFSKKNVFHYISILILLSILGFFLGFNWKIFIRFGYSFAFLFQAISYYFIGLFNPSVEVPLTPYDFIFNGLVQYPTVFPQTSESFWTNFSNWFFIAFNWEYFASSFQIIFLFISNFSLFLIVFLLFVLIYYLLKSRFSKPRDEKLTGETKGLIRYKKFKEKLAPLCSPFKRYLEFLQDKKIYLVLVILVIAFFTEIFTLLIEFIGYLFLILSNILMFPVFGFKLLYSTGVTIARYYSFIPLYIWIIIAFILFLKIRKNNAVRKIQNLIVINEGFCLEHLGVATLVTGVMESGKDSFNSQVTVTMQRIFKQKLLDILYYYRSLFFDFPFNEYEAFIKEAKENHKITLSLQIKMLFKEIKDLYLSGSDDKSVEVISLLGKYEFPKKFLAYKKTIFNGSEPISELELLSEYGQSFFLYIDEKPNVYSNIAMQLFYIKYNNEYFPLFDFDPFTIRSAKTYEEMLHHSKIWNMDTWRLGLRFDTKTGLSDCGIYNLSEGGKERGNMFTNAGKEKDDTVPNQKNDEYNKFIKLVRHVYTIHYFPFIKLLVNDQRLNSINADLNELFETVVSLKKEKKVKNSLLFYVSFEKPILDSLIEKCNNIQNLYRSTRNYYSLFYYFLLKFNSFLTLIKIKDENYFNYKRFNMSISASGIIDDSRKEFYLIYKEAYAGVFATDCYFGFFKPLIEKKDGRNFDFGTYKSKYASLREFDLQNAFLPKEIEACSAFHPPLSDDEWKKKFDTEIRDKLKDYPTRKLKDIYSELHKKYGKQFKNIRYFYEYIRNEKLIKEKDKNEEKKKRK